MEIPRGEDIYVVGMTGNLFLPVWEEQVKSGGGGGGGVGDGLSGLTVSVEKHRPDWSIAEVLQPPPPPHLISREPLKPLELPHEESLFGSKSRFPSVKLGAAKLKTCSHCLLIGMETVIQPGPGNGRPSVLGGLRPGPLGTPAWNHLPASPNEKKQKKKKRKKKKPSGRLELLIRCITTVSTTTPP